MLISSMYSIAILTSYRFQSFVGQVWGRGQIQVMKLHRFSFDTVNHFMERKMLWQRNLSNTVTWTIA